MRSRGHLAVWIGLAVLASVFAQGAPSPEDTASDYQLANQALHMLVATPLGRTLPNLPWKIDLVESWQVNAYSNGRGQIAITRGLAYILGDHPGVWAAAIAHELGHAVMLYPACQPPFDAEFRKAYLASGGNPAGPEAESALKVTPSGGGLLNLKGQRRIEYEADRLGVLLMAEAGFHPDYSVSLDRLMRSATGDQAKFSEFLLSHPLWSDREDQSVRDQGTALAIFNHDWPDAARSPGGAAPPIGGIDSVKVSEDSRAQAMVLQIGFEIRNGRNRQVRLAAVLLDQNRKVRTPLAAFQAPDGSLALNASAPPLDHGSAQITLRIPLAAVAGQPRKLTAELFLVADDWTLSVWFQPLDFPLQN